jgi:hypothetical protein
VIAVLELGMSGKLGVSGEHAIWEEFAELALRPALQDEFGDEVQVGARINVVRDARGDDTQDRRGAFSTFVHPSEEPVFPAENEPAQLALTAIIRQLDIAIFEEEGKSLPLSMQVAERTTERSLRRNDRALDRPSRQ